ncbi:TIGR01841 family phasin [Collimonas humicola]|uniref:TIGR01841 family phasin n=1 Tax=Collimonas humicola TaxID=2825886 RepID=UPI001B8CCFA3|nr:TIGR01841 family phasin [Collimonas humicola]
MSYFSEELASVIKSNLEAQLAITAEFKGKIIKHIEEFSKLNTDAAKAALLESATNTKDILQTSNPRDFFLMNAMHLKHDIQNVVYYGAEAARIAAAMQIEFNKVAGAKAAEASQNGIALLTELTRNMPAGAEKFFAVLTSPMDAFEAANAFAKQMSNWPTEDEPAVASAHQASRKRNGRQAAGTTH